MTRRALLLSLAGLSLLLLGCESEPVVRGGPNPIPVAPAERLEELLVGDEGWEGFRLGESSLGSPGWETGFESRSEGGQPQGLAGPLPPTRRHVARLGKRYRGQYQELCVYAGPDGTVAGIVFLGSHKQLQRGQVPATATYKTSRYLLYEVARGARGVAYWLVDPAAPSQFGILAWAGRPDRDLFKDGSLWSTSAGTPEGSPVVKRPAPVLAETAEELLAKRDFEGAARRLGSGPEDLSLEARLYAEGGVGPYALCSVLRGSSFRQRDFSKDHTGWITYQLWRYFWRLERDLGQGKLEEIEWETLFAMLELELPVHGHLNLTPTLREYRLSRDHSQQVEAVTLRAASRLYEAFGQAYAERLTHLLRRTKWSAAARQRLFFATLPQGAEAGDPLAARRAQAHEELERAWRYGGRQRLNALSIYLPAVQECYAAPAEFEAERRRLWLRLAEDPALYADYVGRWANLSDPEREALLLEWLPADRLSAVRERLRTLAESQREVAQVAERFRFRIDFEHKFDLNTWWRYATVRDGLDASRFGAASQGAEILADYYAHLDQANAGGESGDRDVFARKEAAAMSYVRHYGADASALFLHLSGRDLGRAALDALPPSHFGYVYHARRGGYGGPPTSGIGPDAEQGHRDFLRLARAYSADPKRAINPMVRLLQDRYLRELAKRYYDAYGREAYVHCFLLEVMPVVGVENANTWCNYGIVDGELIRARAQSATILFVSEGSRRITSLTLSGPGEVGAPIGHRFPIHPRGGVDLAGEYSYTGTLDLGDGRTGRFSGKAEVSPPAAGSEHRSLTVTIGS